MYRRFFKLKNGAKGVLVFHGFDRPRFVRHLPPPTVPFDLGVGYLAVHYERLLKVATADGEIIALEVGLRDSKNRAFISDLTCDFEPIPLPSRGNDPHCGLGQQECIKVSHDGKRFIFTDKVDQRIMNTIPWDFEDCIAKIPMKACDNCHLQNSLPMQTTAIKVCDTRVLSKIYYRPGGKPALTIQVLVEQDYCFPSLDSQTSNSVFDENWMQMKLDGRINQLEDDNLKWCCPFGAQPLDQCGIGRFTIPVYLGGLWILYEREAVPIMVLKETYNGESYEIEDIKRGVSYTCGKEYLRQILGDIFEDPRYNETETQSKFEQLSPLSISFYSDFYDNNS